MTYTIDRIEEMANAFGLDYEKFKEIVTTSRNDRELNEHDRFNALLKTVDVDMAKQYFKEKDGVELSNLKLKAKVNKELRDFILGSDEDDSQDRVKIYEYKPIVNVSMVAEDSIPYGKK